MSFAELFIRRPVLSWVLNITLILVGIVSWRQLSVRQYPQIEQPVITVITQFEGAGPEIIEAQISRPLEQALSGLESLDFMISQSESEQSKVKLFFKSTRSLDAAASDVRDRLARVSNLPEDATDPRIRKADADAEPIVYLALYGDKFPVAELNDYAARYLESEIESIQGVASVDLSGAGEYEMHIVLDPIRLAAYKVTARDVADALRQQNFKKPAGRLAGEDREFLVTTAASLYKPGDFNKLVLTEKDGYVVRLSDVGHAVVKADDKRFKVRYNGKTAVMLGIVAQSKANPIEISKEIKNKLEQIRTNLPSGMFIDIANDRSIFIERSIQQVYQSIWEAIILVVLVVFVFLRSFRASLIPLMTIPISLIGAFFILNSLGFTINTLTLLAMVLAIGLVVDDAIVVLENIYRYIEAGMKPLQAAIKGTKEIQFSIIAMTLTLAAVYTPIALSSGVTGKLFTEFALSLAGAVLISGFVALTLSPMMCSRLLKLHHVHSPEETKNFFMKIFYAVDNWLGGFFDKLDRLYEKSLRLILRNRFWVLGAGSGVALLGIFFATNVLQSELAPREDQGVLKILAQSPFGATITYLDRYISQIETALTDVPEIEKGLTVIQAGDESYSMNLLVPWEKRSKSCDDLLPPIREKLEDITGLRVFARCPSRSLMGGASERPLEIVVQTNRSFKELVDVASAIRRVIAKHPGVRKTDLDWNLAEEGQDYVVHVDRNRAASLGVDPNSVAMTLDILISGRRSTNFEKESKQYPVRVWVGEMYRKNPEDILAMYVRGSKNNKETMVPMADIVKVEPRLSNPEIEHFKGQRSVTIIGGLNKGYGLAQVYSELKDEIHQTMPAKGYSISESGELRRYLQESETIFLIFGLAIVFIFLVMAAQFESFRDPFIIMLSVPLALAGAIFTLVLIPSGTINIYSQIGFVTLIGLITKHGILIVDFANTLKQKGDAIEEAIVKACQLRLRPILMTTFAMVLGAIPLALATGAGSEARRQIGWVIVGGMSLGTLFTLLVIPVVYTFVSKSLKEQEGFVE
ncbi:MAG: efflux RND transporter permease subunit [Alphaproteobacteria bacterium]